jgi:hypothetical protein
MDVNTRVARETNLALNASDIILLQVLLLLPVTVAEQSKA